VLLNTEQRKNREREREREGLNRLNNMLHAVLVYGWNYSFSFFSNEMNELNH
jgi:hypothetical protein